MNKKLFRNRKYMVSFGIAFFFFFFSVFILRIACKYVDNFKYQEVGDLLFDILPFWDLSLISNYGFWLFYIVALYYIFFFEPKYAPYFIVVLGLFNIFKATFISVTHLGAPEVRYYLTPLLSGFKDLYAKNDLFPSGHVGLPFLLFLLAKDKKFKILFLSFSIIFFFTMLINRLHYSIDVIGAFFISYAIFCFSEKYIKPKFNLDF